MHCGIMHCKFEKRLILKGMLMKMTSVLIKLKQKKEKTSDNLRKWRETSNLVESGPRFFDKKAKNDRKKEQSKATCIHCKYAFTPQNILRASRNDIRTELQIHGLKQSGSRFDPIKRLAEHYCKPHTHDSAWKPHDIKNLEKQYKIMNPTKSTRGRKKKASPKQSKKQSNNGARRARNRR